MTIQNNRTFGKSNMKKAHERKSIHTMDTNVLFRIVSMIHDAVSLTL